MVTTLEEILQNNEMHRPSQEEPVYKQKVLFMAKNTSTFIVEATGIVDNNDDSFEGIVITSMRNSDIADTAWFFKKDFFMLEKVIPY